MKVFSAGMVVKWLNIWIPGEAIINHIIKFHLFVCRESGTIQNERFLRAGFAMYAYCYILMQPAGVHAHEGCFIHPGPVISADHCHDACEKG